MDAGAIGALSQTPSGTFRDASSVLPLDRQPDAWLYDQQRLPECLMDAYRWRATIDRLDRMDDEDPKSLDAILEEDAAWELWPGHARPAPLRWWNRARHDEAPLAWDVVRALHLEDLAYVPTEQVDALHQITDLRLQGGEAGSVARWLAAPQWTRLRSLALRGLPLTSTLIEQILQLDLESLCLTEVDHAEALVSALLQQSRPVLKRLSLRESELGPASMGRLLQPDRLPSLEHLDLNSEGLWLDELPEHLPALRSLGVSGCELTTDTLRRLQRARFWTRLEALDLSHNELHEHARSVIASVPPTLRRLRIEHIQLSARDLRELVSTLPTSVAHLSMAGTAISADALQHLASLKVFSLVDAQLLNPHALHERQLTTLRLQNTAALPSLLFDRRWAADHVDLLDLSNNGWTGPRETVLARESPIDTVCLDHNPLGDDGIISLVEGGAFRGVRALSVQRVGVGAPGLAALCTVGLESLDVSGNALSPEAISALKQSTGLRHLRLWDCGLSDDSVQELLASETGQGLSRLDIGQNPITDNGLAMMLHLLPPGMDTLGLGRTHLTDASAALLRQVPDHASLSAIAIGAGVTRELGQRYLLLRGVSLQTP